MRLKAHRDAHHVEVVQCALFATRNSLKSQAAKKSISPFSNTRAITLKLCTHSGPTASQNHLASKYLPIRDDLSRGAAEQRLAAARRVARIIARMIPGGVLRNQRNASH
jgi:hypothetical protein